MQGLISGGGGSAFIASTITAYDFATDGGVTEVVILPADFGLSDFDGIEMHVTAQDVTFGGNSDRLTAEVSTDGGSTWDTGASDYSVDNLVLTLPSTPSGAMRSTSAQARFSGADTGVVFAEITVRHLGESSIKTTFASYYTFDGTDALSHRIGYRTTAQAENALRFTCANNMSAGRIIASVRPA